MKDEVKVAVSPRVEARSGRGRAFTPEVGRVRWWAAALVLSAISSFVAFWQDPRPNPLEVPGRFLSWDWCKYPIERNAVQRLSKFSVDLRSIYVRPGSDEIWIAGGSGLIAHSLDGGIAWQVQASGTTARLTSVHFVDAMRGWAVSNSGMILSTTDRGESWQPQTSGTTANLNSVYFVEATLGWAVGSGGTILATVDGGASWRQTSVTTFQLNSVHFADAMQGWAVGDRGAILATTDGGKYWQFQTSGTTANLTSIHFVEAARGWVVGSGGTILATTDGGVTWQQQTSGTTTNLNSVHFVDGERGWAVGQQGTIVATVDRGANWRQQPSGTTTPLGSVRFANVMQGWAVGPGMIMTTKDGGASWQPQAQGLPVGLHSVHFVNSMEGFVAGAGMVMATADGGASWQPRARGLSALQSIHFVDGMRGWGVGLRGTILATMDGGTQWEQQSSGTGVDLWSVSFPDATRGWAVGLRGTILATANGGVTWQQQVTGTTADLRSVHFIDATRGWAVGEFLGQKGWEGTILVTTNGGETWQPQASGVDVPLRSVHFINATQGWAAGMSQTIVATEDGGLNWRRQEINGTATGPQDFWSVSFADSRHGWATDDTGTIMATVDGGHTWQQQFSRQRGVLWSVDFVDAARGWAVGSENTILATVDGGATWRDPRLPYERWPAPWYYLTWIPVGLLIWRSLRKGAPLESESASVADRLVSDRPLEAGDGDALGLKDIALGLSHFLRNENTQPPLTIAITGAWGSGKSSLMNLLRADWKKYRLRPVWFNAWHHQSEEQLLPSLLQSIRSQAVPSWSCLEGWFFRIRIIAIRGWRAAVPLAAVLVILSSSLGWLTYGDANAFDRLNGIPSTVGDLWTNARRLFAALQLDEVAKLVAVLVSFFTLMGMIWNGVKAFGVNPARFLVTPSHPGKGALEVRPGLRQKFATEFQDVTRALRPQRMLIFIDDLDRCRPENVLEVLEGVNFLVSSGDCFVVLGLAREHVEACVGLAFEKVAEEIEELASEILPAKPVHAKRRRVEYARQYLRKLINIEIPVPKLSAAQAQRLLLGGMRDEEAPESIPWKRAVDFLVRLKVIIPVALLAGVLVGPFLIVQAVLEPARSDGQVVIVSSGPPAEEDTPSGSTQPSGAPDARVNNTPGDVTFRAAEQNTYKALTVVTLSWFLVFLGVGWLVLSRRSQSVVKDSPLFQEALNVWYPLVHRSAPTPREQKRFLNRVRYLAMRQRPQGESPTLWRRIMRRFLSKSRPQSSPGTSDSGNPRIPEDLLVALAALHQFKKPLVESEALFFQVIGNEIDKLELLDQEQKGILAQTIISGTVAFTSSRSELTAYRDAYLLLSEGIEVQ